MKFIRTFFRIFMWLILIAVVMLGFYAWKSGLAETFYRENEESFAEIEYELEKVFQSGAEKLSELIPIKAEGRAVDPSQVLKLSGSGISGNGYDFDVVYYPYYSMLSENEKSLYREAYANAKAYSKTFVPSVRITCDRLKSAIEALFYDHPELFWLDTGYSYLFGEGNICVQVTLQFLMEAEDIPAAKEKFDTAVLNIANKTAGCTDDFSREKAVHDAIARSVVYNAEAQMSQSAYSALVLGESVCAGYSRAFQHVLMSLGIPTYYCTGRADGDHSWNIVKLEDGFYNVDLTWDDNIATIYTYFNRTDADFLPTHSREGLSVNLPACVSNRYCGQKNILDSIAGWFAPKISQDLPENQYIPAPSAEPFSDFGKWQSAQDIQIYPDSPEVSQYIENKVPVQEPSGGFVLPGGSSYNEPMAIIIG